MAEETVEKTKGQTFREKTGMSKTTWHNMVSLHLDPTKHEDVKRFKALRKARKAKVKVVQKKKLEANQLYRRSNPRKKKGKKGKQNKGGDTSKPVLTPKT